MADQVTTTKSVAPKPAPKVDPAKAAEAKEESGDAVLDAIQALKDALVDDGMPAETADALLHAVVPNNPAGSVVGNLADLQRMGGMLAEGGTGGSIEEAFIPEGDKPKDDEEKK